LALTLPAGCGRSVGIVCLRTETTEFSYEKSMNIKENDAGVNYNEKSIKIMTNLIKIGKLLWGYKYRDKEFH
jgi:hypothetical protein